MEGLPWYETKEIYCPVVERHVSVRFLTYDGQNPSGVVSCSGIDNPSPLTCGTPCLRANWPDAPMKDGPTS